MFKANKEWCVDGGSILSQPILWLKYYQSIRCATPFRRMVLFLHLHCLAFLGLHLTLDRVVRCQICNTCYWMWRISKAWGWAVLAENAAIFMPLCNDSRFEIFYPVFVLKALITFIIMLTSIWYLLRRIYFIGSQTNFSIKWITPTLARCWTTPHSLVVVCKPKLRERNTFNLLARTSRCSEGVAPTWVAVRR